MRNLLSLVMLPDSGPPLRWKFILNTPLSPKILCFTISACLFASPINQALACGPNFPLELLSARKRCRECRPGCLILKPQNYWLSPPQS